jgi:hypothetical protein
MKFSTPSVYFVFLSFLELSKNLINCLCAGMRRVVRKFVPKNENA